MGEWEIALQAMLDPPAGYKNDPSLLADLLRSGKTPPQGALWIIAELIDPKHKPEKDPGAKKQQQESFLFNFRFVLDRTDSNDKSFRKYFKQFPAVAAMAKHLKAGVDFEDAATWAGGVRSQRKCPPRPNSPAGFWQKPVWTNAIVCDH